MNFNSLQQQHLRTLRKSLNRAVGSLKNGESVVISSGWRYGRAFLHDWLKDASLDLPQEEELYLLFPSPGEDGELAWHQHPAVSESLRSALDFFWPGPLLVTVRLPENRQKLTLGCPWPPLISELLLRNGPVFWSPLADEQERYVRERRDLPDAEESRRLLLWPDEETLLAPTLLDASTVPWRLMMSGFVEPEELKARLSQPFLLSQDRAFPRRPLRTFQPQHHTVVLEAPDRESLIEAIGKVREDVLLADMALRIYVDEEIAHNHFPDVREVLVYGEMADPERVRRRLEAMLERQRRRGGKRLFVIAVSDLTPAADSLKKDLEKMCDSWISAAELQEGGLGAHLCL